jgi:hypothetical protein
MPAQMAARITPQMTFAWSGEMRLFFTVVCVFLWLRRACSGVPLTCLDGIIFANYFRKPMAELSFLPSVSHTEI